MKRLFLVLACVFVSIASAYSFAAPGHRVIATAAFQKLNPAAQKAVTDIMSHSSIPELQDVSSAATWPDDIRKSSTPSHSGYLVKNHNPAALDFNNRFPTNNVWHFINYPLDGTYTPNGKFSSDEDVAHIIGHCIEVLEGNAQGKWAAMHKDEALAWLIHTVGDIHQPLHVGEGFYEFDGDNALLITDPTLALQYKKNDDSGGNDLYYTKSEEFHAFWDKDMVAYVSVDEGELAQKIVDIIDSSHFSNSGDYHEWANSWATQSIRAAKQAYSALVSGEENRIGSRRPGSTTIIDITLDKNDYKKQFGNLIKQQLGKAAYDLSDLLNHIQWQ